MSVKGFVELKPSFETRVLVAVTKMEWPSTNALGHSILPFFVLLPVFVFLVAFEPRVGPWRLARRFLGETVNNHFLGEFTEYLQRLNFELVV